MIPRASPQPNRAWIEWVVSELAKRRTAQGIEAFGRDRETGRDAKHESPVREANAPNLGSDPTP